MKISNIKYTLLFFPILLTSCVYYGTLSVNDIDETSSSFRKIKTTIFLDERKISNFSNINYSPALHGSITLNIDNASFNSLSKVFIQTFDEVETKNKNNAKLEAIPSLKYTTQENRDHVIYKITYEISFHDAFSGKLLKRYYTKKDIKAKKSMSGFIDIAFMGLTTPVTGPARAIGHGTDIKDGYVKFLKETNQELILSLHQDRSMFAKYEIDEESRDEQLKDLIVGITPIGSIGKFSEKQVEFFSNKLYEIISEKYKVIPKSSIEKAVESAFNELEYEECTEEQCIRYIQDALQTENLFTLSIVSEEKLTQLSLKVTTLDQIFVETVECFECGTYQILGKIEGLVNELSKKIL